MSTKALEICNATKEFHKNGKHSLLTHLRKRSDTPKKAVVAVDNVSLTVERGEIFGILGPNGAGKTTLLAYAAGALISDAVRVFGTPVTKKTAPEIRRQVESAGYEGTASHDVYREHCFVTARRGRDA